MPLSIISINYFHLHVLKAMTDSREIGFGINRLGTETHWASAVRNGTMALCIDSCTEQWHCALILALNNGTVHWFLHWTMALCIDSCTEQWHCALILALNNGTVHWFLHWTMALCWKLKRIALIDRMGWVVKIMITICHRMIIFSVIGRCHLNPLPLEFFFSSLFGT